VDRPGATRSNPTNWPGSPANPTSNRGWSPSRPTAGSSEHGPLAESRFARLGSRPWTLLVQAVDHHVPALAGLLAAFRFIPNWRIDDVMVSYAVDGGGVGPHFDQYDVFLVQGLGRRRWQVGGPCDQSTALLPHDDLRLLASSSRPTNGSSSRATSSISLRAWPTTAWPSATTA
jgi:hypothetical protein